MKRKIVGILVVTLLIASTVLPVVGNVNIGKENLMDRYDVSNEDTSSSLTNHVLWSGTGDNLHNIATLPSLDLSACSQVQLSFWKQYEIYAPDYFQVQISSDGASWMVLEEVTGVVMDWILNVIDLSGYAGMSDVYIRLVYHTESNSLSQGIHIDNVVVTCDGATIYEQDFESGAPGWQIQGWTITEKPAPGDPCLEVEKEVQDANGDWVEYIEACICENVKFKITIKNCGICDLSDFDVTDTLPDCLEYVPGSSSAGEPQINNNELYWPFHGPQHVLPPGGSFSIIFDAHVISEGNNTNCVLVTADYQGGQVSDSDCATVFGKNCNACIEVEKEVRVVGVEDWQEEVTAMVGTEVEFKIRVHNCGFLDLTNIVVIDTLPPCLKYISTTSGHTPIPPPITWVFPGPLAYCSSEYITFIAEVISADDDLNINNVSVSADSTAGKVYDHDTANVIKQAFEKPEEFILVCINNTPYYIPWWPNHGGFGTPLLVDSDFDSQNQSCGDGRIVDLDNDGDLDIVQLQGNRITNLIELVWYENTPACFQRHIIRNDYPPGTGHWGEVSKVVTGCFFDDDADWDIIVLLVRGSVATLQGWENTLGVGTGWNLATMVINLPPGLNRPRDIEAADYDKGDGFHDLIISDYPTGGAHDGEAYFFKGSNDGNFVSPSGPCITLQEQPLPNMVSGDFIDNNVCSVDIIAGLDDDGDPGQAYLFSNGGTAGFSYTLEAFDTNPVDETTDYDCNTGTAMDAKDFDKDGELDIVTSWSYPYGNPTNHELFYLQGVGDGTFPDPGVGNMIHGNARLIAAPEDRIRPTVEITRPMPGNLYFDDWPWPFNPLPIPSSKAIIFGLLRSEFTITATADDAGCWSLAGVEFYIDNKFRSAVFLNDPNTPPYSWTWTPLPSGFLTVHTIDVIAYDNAGNGATDSIDVWIWAK